MLISSGSARHVSISMLKNSSAHTLWLRFRAKVLSHDCQRTTSGPLRKTINLDLLCFMIWLDWACRSLWIESIWNSNAEFTIGQRVIITDLLRGAIREIHCLTFAGFTSWGEEKERKKTHLRNIKQNPSGDSKRLGYVDTSGLIMISQARLHSPFTLTLLWLESIRLPSLWAVLFSPLFWMAAMLGSLSHNSVFVRGGQRWGL